MSINLRGPCQDREKGTASVRFSGSVSTLYPHTILPVTAAGDESHAVLLEPPDRLADLGSENAVVASRRGGTSSRVRYCGLLGTQPSGDPLLQRLGGGSLPSRSEVDRSCVDHGADNVSPGDSTRPFRGTAAPRVCQPRLSPRS